MQGTVEAINIAAEEAGPVVAVGSVAAHAGRGLEGDRYFDGGGKFKKVKAGRHATLIEAEVFDALARDYGIDADPAESRRNIVTRGVALNHLVDRTFRVGDATFRGIKLCEPCSYMEKLAGKPLREPLKHRGGLRAEILESGTITVGDAIAPVDLCSESEVR